MNDLSTIDAYGVVTEPATLTIQRLLPGPIERVWSYLTDSDLRKQWLASGVMGANAGSTFEFVWRNAELTDPPGNRPKGFPDEHRLACEITEIEPPHKLAFTWGRSGGVSIALEQAGSKVLLTLIHKRLADRESMLNVSAGWHAHLDLLVARVAGRAPSPFWDTWLRLKGEYGRRIQA